jgi:hypothetical protein
MLVADLRADAVAGFVARAGIVPLSSAGESSANRAAEKLTSRCADGTLGAG